MLSKVCNAEIGLQHCLDTFEPIFTPIATQISLAWKMYILHALLKCNDVNFDPKQISELSIYGNDFLYLKIDKITFQTGV